MRVLGLLGFILASSARNRLRAQFRRMKNPRYLVATIIGLTYFWFFIGRRLYVGGSLPPLSGDIRVLIATAGSLFAFPFAAIQWVFARERAALTFSEAEIQFLFPAPVSRTSLVLYRVSRTLVLVLLSAVVAAFFFGARLTGHVGFFVIGAWSVLSLLSLHEMVASLSRQSLRLLGARGMARLTVVGLAIGLALCALAFVSWQQLPLPTVSSGKIAFEDLSSWTRKFQQTPLGLVTRPLRAPIELALSESPREFLRALPWTLGLLGGLGLLVFRSDVAFEEASVEEAEKRARRAERRRGRRERLTGSPKSSFRLSAKGRPEWAVAWKGLIAARRLMVSQVMSLLVPLVLFGGVFGVIAGRSEGRVGALGGLAGGLLLAAGVLVLIGPTTVRSDLRLDMKQLEILRTWPLSGAQIVSGELLGPLTVLTGLQWLLITLALLLSVPVDLPGFPLPLRVAAALCAAIVCPPVTLCGLLVQNAAVLLFPAWVSQGAEQARGFEATGQRLLTFAGGLVVWVVGLIPAGLVGGGILLLSWFTVGPIASPVAALAGGAVLAFEAYVVILMLGRWFDRYDVSTDT